MSNNASNSPQPANANAYAPPQNLVFGYENGKNPRDNAMNYQLELAEEQSNLNNTHSGGRSRRVRRSKRGKHGRVTAKKGKKHNAKRGNRKMRSARRHHKGGESARVEVPSFPVVGPQVSPMTSTSNSVATNETLLTTNVNACNDCYATNTCGSTPGCPQSGGKSRRRARGRKGHKGKGKKMTRRHKKGGMSLWTADPSREILSGNVERLMAL